MVYLVSYDLNQPGQDYSRIIKAIAAQGAYIQVLKSAWLLRSSAQVLQVGDALKAHIDASDRLLVSEVTANHRGWLDQRCVEWLQQHL